MWRLYGAGCLIVCPYTEAGVERAACDRHDFRIGLQTGTSRPQPVAAIFRADWSIAKPLVMQRTDVPGRAIPDCGESAHQRQAVSVPWRLTDGSDTSLMRMYDSICRTKTQFVVSSEHVEQPTPINAMVS